VGHQNIGFLCLERFDILRPDGGGAQRVRQCRLLPRPIRWSKAGEVVRELVTVPQPGRRQRRPHARAERSAQSGDPMR
jgi:hypothetical protein